jgi:hypothetical protein
VALLAVRDPGFVGIAGPPDGIVGWTRLDRIDRATPLAYELRPRDPSGAGETLSGGPGVALRLFVRADRSAWDPGAYRFITSSGDGAPRVLYACLLDPVRGNVSVGPTPTPSLGP